MEPNIEHIMICAGGTFGFSYYGILKETHQQKLWNIKNIKSVHTCSIGAILGTLLCLGLTWEELDDVVINYNWSVAFRIGIMKLMMFWRRGGIYNRNVIVNSFEPIFKKLNIPINITLEDFYKINNIDIYFATIEIKSFKNEYISHLTHPHWKLVDAIYSSISIPLLFEPLCIDNNLFYVDGGLQSSFPSKVLLDNKINLNNVLCVGRISNYLKMNKVDKSYGFFGLIIYFFNLIFEKYILESGFVEMKYQILIYSPLLLLVDIISVSIFHYQRKNLVNLGVNVGKEFMYKINNE